MARPLVSDTAFTQTAIGVLVTLALALLLQARLLGAAKSHPISTRGHRGLVIFELYLTTALSTVGVGLAYILFHHLAVDGRPFGLGDRRAIELFLLLLLLGLAFSAGVSRVVAVAWKPPDRAFLEPELDDELVSNLWVALLLAVLVALVTLVLLVAGELLLAGLLILVFGAVAAILGPYLAVLRGARSSRRSHSRFEAAVAESGYEACLADVTLPGGLGQITVKILQRGAPGQADCLTYSEATRLVRHINGAWEHVRRSDPSAAVPRTNLRLRWTRDLRLTVLGEPLPDTGGRHLTPFWPPEPRSGVPRGLVTWIHGEDIPALPAARVPLPPERRGGMSP